MGLPFVQVLATSFDDFELAFLSNGCNVQCLGHTVADPDLPVERPEMAELSLMRNDSVRPLYGPSAHPKAAVRKISRVATTGGVGVNLMPVFAADRSLWMSIE
jgi:hypothetical protein